MMRGERNVKQFQIIVLVTDLLVSFPDLSILYHTVEETLGTFLSLNYIRIESSIVTDSEAVWHMFSVYIFNYENQF